GDRWRRGTAMTAGRSICMSGLYSPSRRTNQSLGARQRRASVKQQSNDPDGALDLGFGRDDGVLVEESLGQADDRVGEVEQVRLRDKSPRFLLFPEELVEHPDHARLHIALARGEDLQGGVSLLLQEDLQRSGVDQRADILVIDRKNPPRARVLAVVGLGAA